MGGTSRKRLRCSGHTETGSFCRSGEKRRKEELSSVFWSVCRSKVETCGAGLCNISVQNGTPCAIWLIPARNDAHSILCSILHCARCRPDQARRSCRNSANPDFWSSHAVTWIQEELAGAAPAIFGFARSGLRFCAQCRLCRAHQVPLNGKLEEQDCIMKLTAGQFGVLGYLQGR